MIKVRPYCSKLGDSWILGLSLWFGEYSLLRIGIDFGWWEVGIAFNWISKEQEETW